jgi:hypothetical protein
MLIFDEMNNNTMFPIEAPLPSFRVNKCKKSEVGAENNGKSENYNIMEIMLSEKSTSS